MWNGVSQDVGGRLKCKISGPKTSSLRTDGYRPVAHHVNDCSQLGGPENTRITHTGFVISHQTAETIIDTTWDRCSVLMGRLDSKFPMRFLRLFQGPSRPELSALRNSITWRLRDNYCESKLREGFSRASFVKIQITCGVRRVHVHVRCKFQVPDEMKRITAHVIFSVLLWLKNVKYIA